MAASCTREAILFFERTVRRPTCSLPGKKWGYKREWLQREKTSRSRAASRINPSTLGDLVSMLFASAWPTDLTRFQPRR